jgi:hypothetical protein
MHGGGWILGNTGTHDRLVRELAVGAAAAVEFVEYDRSPESRYPVAIEQDQRGEQGSVGPVQAWLGIGSAQYLVAYDEQLNVLGR